MPPQVPTISVAQLPDGATVLDVREDDEWTAGHVAGAQHLPLSEFVARLEEVPREGELVVVCRVGSRSAQATAYLRQLGLEAVNLDGGMLAWEAAGRPVVSETGSPPAVI